MFDLRHYQKKLYREVRQAFEEYKYVLMVLPTGGGKTVVFSALLSAVDQTGGAVAAIVHRREILEQISRAMALAGIKHRVIAPSDVVAQVRRDHQEKFGKSFVDQNARAGVASAQTLTSKASSKNPAVTSWVEQIEFCVFDEGHHYVEKGQWGKAVKMLPDSAEVLFVTACAERADGIGLGKGHGGFAEVIVEGPPTAWLIENGFLTPFKYLAPPCNDLDISNVAVTASGDFNARALRQAVKESHLVGDVVQHYQASANNTQAIVFATDVETAEEIAAKFRSCDIKAMALSGDTETGTRNRSVKDFAEGRLKVLVNVGLFDEGFDVPAVVTVVLASPTESLNRFLQMVGRGLRILDGKEHAIIIDPVGNWLRHGMPDWPRTWSLAGKEKGERSTGADLAPQVYCKACTRPYRAFHKCCPYCGAYPEIADKTDVKQVHGDLEELDVEALRALFRKKEYANMSDEEFERDMIARDVPEIGRGAALKRFQALKYRRGVLENLIGWWVGAQQPRRPLHEIHRRFFFRFGVDVVQAFALDAKATEKLIEDIKNKFSVDARPDQ